MATRLLQVGRSLLVGAALGVRRVRAERLRPLDFTPFDAALDALAPARDREIAQLTAGVSIAQVQDAMAAGLLTCEELTTHLLARVRERDETLCSVIELNPAALTEARAADARRRDGALLGRLDGIPITLKDNIETAAPMRTTAGSMALAEHVAADDAPLVRSLRRAGVVVLGKANLSELAGAVARAPGVSAVGGQTANPFGTAFSPGGSSSGSAVSVAAGLALASIGTETSGSLIAPAAFNGVVGMKPSRTLVSADGVVPLVRSQDSPGPLGRCVADVAAVLDAIATGGLDVDLSPGALRGVPVGVLSHDIRTHRTPLEDTSDNEAVLARIVAGLRDAHADATDVSIADRTAVQAFEAGFAKVVLGGLTHDTMDYLAAAGAPAARLADLHAFNLAQPRRRMPKGQFFLSLARLYDLDRTTYEQAALEHRRMAAQILDRTFAEGGCDVLASVTNRHSSLYATAGYPAVTVPLGRRANGMPVGVTLIGRPDQDGRLLAYAYAFEQAGRPDR